MNADVAHASCDAPEQSWGGDAAAAEADAADATAAAADDAAAEADAAEDAATAAAAAQHSLLSLPGLDPPPPNVDWAAIRSAAGVMPLPDGGGLPPLLAESAP